MPAPLPTGWQNIKTSYDTLHTKLQDDKKDGGADVTPQDRLDAITYWMSMLVQDAATIGKKGKP